MFKTIHAVAILVLIVLKAVGVANYSWGLPTVLAMIGYYCYYFTEMGMEIYDEANEQKEKDETATERNRILQIVWDVLHRGYSIDTVADQDWVYERIRNKVVGTYPEGDDE